MRSSVKNTWFRSPGDTTLGLGQSTHLVRVRVRARARLRVMVKVRVKVSRLI